MPNNVVCSPNDILNFWYNEIQPEDWFKKSDTLDNKIADKFLFTYQRAILGELFGWRSSIDGRLAEIILLDQFARSMFRGKAEAFAYDILALTLAQEACRLQEAKDLAPNKKSFLYMPFMHSESILVHEVAVELFSEPGLEQNYKFELAHKRIIERFGRYPHRNEVLGRTSTPEEIEFLKTPGSSF
ncbi:MAG: DUF924 family protein [Bdellovibrionales bacterium]